MIDESTSSRKAVTLSQSEIDAFWRDGVICVRQLYSPAWVERIAAFLDEIVSTPSMVWGPGDTHSKFKSDINCWLTNDEVRDFVLNGPGAAIAQQVFGSQRVNFYYDQIFVKEKLSPEPTPWHHDATFWGLAGDQVASLWTSVDPVTAETSALEFVAGSHRWRKRFRAIGVGGVDMSTGQGLEEVPDVDANRSEYNIVSWDLQPGDALLFHALTLHGSRGNRSPDTKRRAIATRWCGDDVVYRAGKRLELCDHGLSDGDPLSCWLYPQVLPHVLPEQISARMAGPILPKPEALARASKFMSQLDRVEVRPDPAVAG